LEFEVWATATIDTLPSILRLQVKDKQDKVLASMNLSMAVEQFTRSLYPKPAADDAVRNIFIFGLAGSTKSSFINSCYSMLDSEMHSELATSGGNAERVTTELKGYRLAKISEKLSTKYRLWDTWGVERSNYNRCEFELILTGKASNGWKMEEASLSRLGDNSKPVDARFIQNSVIFFIPAAELETDESDLLKRTQDFMRIATSHQVSSLLVLSKMDALEPLFKTNPSPQIGSVPNRIQKASNLFNLPPNRIFPLKNYQDDRNKNFEIDRLIFKILQAAADVADTHCRRTGNTIKSEEDKRIHNLIFDL